MNKRFIIVFLIIGLFTVQASYSQPKNMETDSIKTDTSPYFSIYNLRPVLLNKGQIVVSENLRFPEFYKSYNPQTGSLEKLSPVLVLSETYFNTLITYGIANKVNIFTTIPIVDIHHYSPMVIQTGKGIGDIELGATLQLLDIKKNGTNALSAELKTSFPTGKYKNLEMSDYATGMGSYRIMPRLNGIHKFKKIDFWYSAYYEYRTNQTDKTMGDETGINLNIQRVFINQFGAMGIETGTNSYYNFEDQSNGLSLPNTEDYSVDLYIGAWYKYLDKFFLRFGVPYSVYQNNAWLTKYQVMLQLDYLIN